MHRLKILVSAVLALGLIVGQVEAQKPSSRPGTSSKPSSGSSYKPSSRPPSSFGSAPKTSTPSSRPPSSFGSSAPKTSTPSSRPSSAVPSTPSSKPVQSQPSSGFGGIFGGSSKPQSGGFDSQAASAKKREESAKVYQAATKPKDEYVAPSGKTVKIDSSKPSVSTIRDTVSADEYASRSTRVEKHYHTYYGDRYSTYRTRPIVDVGGGYSPLFWWAVMDWNAQRQAQWFYHNQNSINQSLYQQQLATNTALRLEIERLKAASTPINPNYVDPEFATNPDLMYDDAYVQAVYNPQPQPQYQSRPLTPEEQAAQNAAIASFFKWVGIILLCGFGLWAVVYFCFVKDYKKFKI
jgi:hypothetical protein